MFRSPSSFSFSNTSEQDRKTTLLSLARSSSTIQLQNYVEANRIDLKNLNLTDDYDQTLLHIAVRTKNYNLSKYLIGNGINKNKFNRFNETPIDIAMKNNDCEMLQILFDNQVDKNLMIQFKNENIRLNERVKDVENNFKTIVEANKKLTQEKNILIINLDNEKNSRKRKADECDLYEGEIKKLRTENNRLKTDNTTLSNTITNIRGSMKK